MNRRQDFIGAESARRIDSARSELVEALRGQLEPERAAAVVAELAVAAAQAATGVCRKRHASSGFADLIPVLDDEGLRYCCTGDPQHCSTQIAT